VRKHMTGSAVAMAAMLGTLCLTSIPASAQGNDQKGKQTAKAAASAKPVPRMPDGHPDLGNGRGSWDVKKVDDMSGNGAGERPGEEAKQRQLKFLDHHVDVPFLPAAKAIYDQREATVSKDDPEGFCLPPGVPRLMNTPFPMQIYQLPDRILEVFEGGAHMWRVIYMDGRKHTPPDKWNPTYFGEGIGHWEGDTLVVDVIGFNDRTWLDSAGHPHTEQLHVTERYTRTSYDNLHYEATIDDPGSYSKPWSNGWNIKWVEGMEPYEYVCQENNKDVVIENHMVGVTAGEKREKR